jgi:hypothetical protein
MVRERPNDTRAHYGYPEVKSRVAALQTKAAERLTVDLAWIYERLVEIASRAPYSEEIKTGDKLRALDMLIRLGGYYAPEKKVVAPAGSKSVRLTEVFDAEQLKTRMTVVELLQVMNDESYPPSVRFEAAKAALPFCRRAKDKEPVTEGEGGTER